MRPLPPVRFRMSFILAITMVIAVPSLFYFGRPARSPIAAPQFFFWPERSSIAVPRFFFRPARSPIAAPQFFFWPARFVDCRAAIFLFAGAIRRLPRRIFWPAQSADCHAAIFL
jgi:hypothetical protein